MARDVAVIHGPPGTGKTTTIVELIRQFNIRNKRVLACAPSNIAVDNIIELLVRDDDSYNITRIGHPARINDKIKKYCLDYKMMKSDDNEVFKDIYNEMNEINGEIKKCKNKIERKSLYGDLKSLRIDLSKRQESSINTIIKQSKVICSTCVGSALKVLKNENFDVVIIDECGQAIELLCYIPILKGKTVILAGDHLQLPPTILCKKNEKMLEKSLLEMIVMKYQFRCVFMLNIQYRMNEIISNWSSNCLYNNNLLTFENNKNITLSNFNENNNNEIEENYPPMVFIDTNGCSFDESIDEDDSKYNIGEASIVIQYINRLILLLGINEENIGIISPYHAQVTLIKENINSKYPKIEIHSVDGFQGREKEIIILSLVRSNSSGEIGFLKEFRRINVAITRAKRHICVIGDNNTIGRDEFIHNLVDYIDKNGLVYNGNDFIHSDDFNMIEITTTTTTTTTNINNIKENINKKKKSSNNNNKKEIKRNQQEVIRKDLKVENKVIINEEEKEEIDIESTKEYKQFYNIISAFIKTQIELENNSITTDDNITNLTVPFCFPKSLTSYQRLLIHQICEKLHIENMSQGEGKDRYITIIYRKKKKEVNKKNDETIKQSSPPPPAVVEPSPSPLLISSELDKTQTPLINKNVKVNKDKKNKENNIEKNSDDFDEIIKDAQIGVSKCGVRGCKAKNVVLLGANCKYCKLRYCFSHMQPELHGCGEAVRKAAREEFKESISNTKPKNLKEYQHNAIKNQFNKKLVDKVKQRTKTKKEKK